MTGLSIGCTPSERPRFPSAANRLLATFPADRPERQDYERLFRYFLAGFLAYQDQTGALASYPGLPSTHGERVDAMEGFTRFAPLAAVWLRSGRPPVVDWGDGRPVDLIALIRRGLLSGTDSSSAAYWGGITDYDQRMVEASDVALVLWLTRDLIWDRLPGSDREQIQGWLAAGLTHLVANNNWHLFNTFVSVVLRDLGAPVDMSHAVRHYARFKTYYRGDGWFSDGPGGVFDYYNAWGIHYQLYWIGRVSPEWDREFIGSARGAFVRSYKYLIGRTGFPIRGRSICYRLAAPVPLILEYTSTEPSITAGEARRALDLTWSYFIRRGAIREGGVTQGYCGADERILDDYSGAASCLWSLRSLVAAFELGDRDPFWTGPAGSLPIDLGSYRIRVEAVGWTIMGDAQTGVTSLTSDDSLPDSETGLASGELWSTIKPWLLGRGHRVASTNAQYHQGTYSSMPPFCGCLPD